MFRKLIVGILLFSVAVGMLASCEISEKDPLVGFSGTGSSSQGGTAFTPVDSSAPFFEISLIDVTNSTVSDEESSVASFDDSSVDAPVTYPDPVCSQDHIDTPVNPDFDPVPIRSLTQTQKNVLLTAGEIDTDDPQVSAVLQRIEDLIDGYDKKVSFCAYALDGSRAITYNCEEEFFSACTIKAGFLLYCCLAIDQGLASADEVMYYQEKYYHKGSGIIQFSEYGTPYTLKRLIELCLSISDNVAYEMLSAYFGHTGYNEMIETLGVERLKLGSSIWNYKMTARDLSIIWREIYFYFQTNTPMAQWYYQSCTNTRFNYATVYLTENYSHKSGDNFGTYAVYNDGAIVWADRPYVIAIMTNSEGTQTDEELVGTIVKLINDSLMK